MTIPRIFFKIFLLINAIFLSNCNFSNQKISKVADILEYADLKDIYATQMPQELRKILDDYSKLDLSDEENKRKIEKLEIEKFLLLFKEKFIVGSLRMYQDNRFCKKPSYLLGIFISYEKMYSLDIILYKTDNGKYEICEIRDFEMSDYRKKRYFYWRNFKKYWI